MSKIKKLIVFGVITAILLTGCKTKYGSIPSEQEVLDEMSKVVEQENYELVEKEEKKTKPKACVYYFKSTDRDLEFTATSSLTHNSFLGAQTTDYKEKISNDYADSVKDLYYDEIINIFKQSDLYDEKNNSFIIENNNQYNDVLRILLDADKIYSEENQYNSEEWMKNNPVMYVELNFVIDNKTYYGSKVGIVGGRNEDEMISDMNYCRDYAEKFLNEIE